MTEVGQIRYSVLVVDDEIEVGAFLRRLLEKKGYDVVVANSGAAVKNELESNTFNLALVDLKLPDSDGLTLLQQIKACQPSCEVIIMTGYSTTRTAVRAIQMGAFDYIDKPFEDIGELEDLIEGGLNSGVYSGEEGAAVMPEWAGAASDAGFKVGASTGMNRLAATAYRIARKNINVLIHGETGTGKEVLARFIHSASSRADRVFIPVNCGALPENLLESELFGHEKGAFTGATGQRKGIFELAHQGTLFLDEIGEASQSIQVKLLRVLETGEFLRIGGEKPIKIDVRIIAATNVDLELAVKNKKFREDLFYRLDVVRLTVPPLRSRKEDIPFLAAHFVKKYADKNDRKVLEISPETTQLLLRHNWPGNVRELANSIEKAVVLCDGPVVSPEHIPERISEKGRAGSELTTESGVLQSSLPKWLQQVITNRSLTASLSDDELLAACHLAKELEKKLLEAMTSRGIPLPLPPPLHEVEARAVSEALQYFNGNVTMTARLLGIGRNTLYRKMKEYKITAV